MWTIGSFTIRPIAVLSLVHYYSTCMFCLKYQLQLDGTALNLSRVLLWMRQYPISIKVPPTPTAQLAMQDQLGGFAFHLFQLWEEVTVV